ncbi:MAG: hypothetical protein IPF60_17075 [Betaproteobacteria bacterium]|nr:hypothetical protein [Betaproteobacteria bacterium]
MKIAGARDRFWGPHHDGESALSFIGEGGASKGGIIVPCPDHPQGKGLSDTEPNGIIVESALQQALAWVWAIKSF